MNTDKLKLMGPGVYLEPPTSLDTAIEWLQKRKVEGETVVATQDVINAHPFDAALAIKKAFERKFGFLPLDTNNRPNIVQVPNGVGTTVEVPIGRYLLPGTEGQDKHAGGFMRWLTANLSGGYLDFSPAQRGGRWVLMVTGQVKMNQRELVNELLADAKAIAKAESIYLNKVIKLDFSAASEDFFDAMPQFIDVGGVTDEDLILPADVENLVATALWTPIEFPEQVKAAGVPTKRGILLEGPPGTGKTLTLNLAAQKAQKNGATVLYIEDVTQLDDAIAFMQDYGRGVIIAEDVERVMPIEATTHRRSEAVSNLLNALDGIQAKGTEIMVILTTNYVEQLDKALLRPGRFDAVVPVRAPDRATVIRQMQRFGRGLIDPRADLTEAAIRLEGQIPAVIREVVERAKLAQIRRTKGQGGDGLLVGADLKIAADGMVHHLSLLTPKVVNNEDAAITAAKIQAEAIAKAVGSFAPASNGEVKPRGKAQKEAGYAGPVGGQL